MAEPQPWRNPRPAPNLAEIRAKTPAPRSLAWLRAWWPAILWAAVIFFMSTDTFSAEHTASVMEPILRWVRPGITKTQFEAVHYLIRKSAHFSEYFIFCLFIYRAVRGERKGWRWTWGFMALFCAAGYSALDEIHQAFVASRTASAYDSLLDSVGAFFAMAVLWLWFRLRREGALASTSAPDPAS
ncbi:MAG TPA: VanZ family protein [Candidatus Acidoferrum sp.]|nr:VanZ family protein [Candidatus Acidoferrum sp.]